MEILAGDADSTRGGGPVRRWLVLAAVSTGGAVGALARYGLASAWPGQTGAFPWATFVINVSGCLLLGGLMVLVTEARPAHPLVRPFLGVGVLGGYTTFSTYAVETRGLVTAGTVGTGLAYAAGTLFVALAAVYAGTVLARLAVGVPVRTATALPDPALPDPARPGPKRFTTAPFRAERFRAERFRGEPFRAEPFHAEPFHAEPLRAEPLRAEPFLTSEAPAGADRPAGRAG
jgi:CrcB protein